MLDYSIENNRSTLWLFIAVLVICIFYTLQYIQRTYTGVVLAGGQSGWTIQSMDCVGDCSLQVGDVVTQIAEVTFVDAATDRRLAPFGSYMAGDTIELHIVRQGTPLIIQWIVPFPDVQWHIGQAIIILYYAPFLIMALVMLRWSEPRNEQWWLLYLFFLGYALWIVTGVVSPTTIGYSSIVLHVLTWLLAALLLQLHWQIPSVFMPLPRWVWPTLYTIATFLALLELLQLTPRSLFLLGILIPLLVSFCLLALRLPKAATTNRRSVQVMFLGLIVAATPGITWILIGLFTQPPSLSMTVVSSVSLGAWPFFYWYGVYYKHIGYAEPKVQTVAISVLFIVIVTNGMSILVTYAGVLLGWQEQILQFNVLATAVIVVVSAVGYNGVRLWFGRYLFKERGAEMDRAAAWLSRQLPYTSDRDIMPTLTHLMERLTLTESLIYVDGVVIFTYGIQSIQTLPPAETLAWVHQERPFAVGETKGAWLLGTRAGDDYYPIHEQKRLDGIAQQIGAMLEMRRLYKVQADTMTTERANSLGRMAYDMAHTLRTPLMALLLDIEYIEDFSDDPDFKDSAQGALATAKEMSRLLDEMLILVRSDETAFVKLKDVIHRALQLIEGYAIQNGVTITITIANQQLGVSGVESRLVLAVQNLLVNAIQAMPTGGDLTVTVSERGDTVLICVADTGYGIKEEELDKIFTPFFTTKEEGTGWGLSQSHSIIEMHNGRVDVESIVGQGTIFTITLPLAKRVHTNVSPQLVNGHQQI